MRGTLRTFNAAVALVFSLVFCTTSMIGQTSQNMTQLGNYGKGEGQPRTVASSGSVVYYSIGTAIQIASFATPGSPQKVASFETAQTIRDIAATTFSAQKHIIVLAGSDLVIINVQNPLAPTQVSKTALGTTAQQLVVSGGRAYLAAGSGGLKIYNLTNPAAPSLESTMDTLSYCEGVAFSSPYVYLAAAGRTHIVNATNPAAPTYVAQIPAQSGGYHQNVGVLGQYAYICDVNLGLHVVNISNPASPVTTMVPSSGAGAGDIYFDGNYAYVAHWELGLKIYDISTGGTPSSVGTWVTTGVQAQGIAFSGIGSPVTSHVFLAARTGGLRAVNVSTPASPTETSSLPVQAAAAGSAFFVTMAGNTAYVAYGTGGLRIIDVTTKTAPTHLGVFDTPGEARGVAVSGTTAYVADRAGGVRVLNVTTPASISELGFVTLNNPRNIVLQGSTGYVADYDSGMTVVDLSNSASPTKVKSYVTALYNAENIWKQDSLVFVALGAKSEDGAKIQIYNVAANPATPAFVSEISLPHGYTEGATPSGTNLYMAHGDSLKIFNIANPASPVLRSSKYIGSYTRHIAVAGNYAYSASGGYGIRVYNVSNPDNPTEVGFYDGVPAIRGVAASGSYVFSAEQADGFSVYSNSLVTSVTEEASDVPAAFDLYQNYPNPFNPATTIRYALRTEMMVTISVTNLLGQQVAVLASGRQSAGEHSLSFNAAGMKSGIYFITMEAEGQQQTLKMLLLK